MAEELVLQQRLLGVLPFVLILIIGAEGEDEDASIKIDVEFGGGMDEGSMKEVVRMLYEQHFGSQEDFNFELEGRTWVDVVTYNALKRNGLTSLELISGWTRKEIEDIANIGVRRAGQIMYMMNKNGYPNWGHNDDRKS